MDEGQLTRARTLRAQGLANRVVRTILRTPLLCRAAGARLLVVYVVGRKSGRRYTVPVAYLSHEGALLVGSPFGWIRNLRTGESVEIRLKGKRVPADVVVVADESGVVNAYRLLARENHNFAKFNKINFDSSGEPESADLHSAWAGGARVAKLSPRPLSTAPKSDGPHR